MNFGNHFRQKCNYIKWLLFLKNTTFKGKLNLSHLKKKKRIQIK